MVSLEEEGVACFFIENYNNRFGRVRGEFNEGVRRGWVRAFTGADETGLNRHGGALRYRVEREKRKEKRRGTDGRKRTGMPPHLA